MFAPDGCKIARVTSGRNGISCCRIVLVVSSGFKSQQFLEFCNPLHNMYRYFMYVYRIEAFYTLLKLNTLSLSLSLSLSVQLYKRIVVEYVPKYLIYLFIWGLTPYQWYFSYLKATIHKSMFPGLFLSSINQSIILTLAGRS